MHASHVHSCLCMFKHACVHGPNVFTCCARALPVCSRARLRQVFAPDVSTWPGRSFSFMANFQFAKLGSMSLILWTVPFRQRHLLPLIEGREPLEFPWVCPTAFCSPSSRWEPKAHQMMAKKPETNCRRPSGTKCTSVMQNMWRILPFSTQLKKNVDGNVVIEKAR